MKNLLLKNHMPNFNQSILGWRGSKFVQVKKLFYVYINFVFCEFEFASVKFTTFRLLSDCSFKGVFHLSCYSFILSYRVSILYHSMLEQVVRKTSLIIYPVYVTIWSMLYMV